MATPGEPFDFAALTAALAALPPPDPDPIVRFEMNPATWARIRAATEPAEPCPVYVPFAGIPVRIVPWPDGVVRTVRKSDEARAREAIELLSPLATFQGREARRRGR